jgi:hypothetical protein
VLFIIAGLMRLFVAVLMCPFIIAVLMRPFSAVLMRPFIKLSSVYSAVLMSVNSVVLMYLVCGIL